MNINNKLKPIGIALLLFVLFAAPVLLAFFLLDSIYLKKYFPSRNHGELITQYLPLSTLQLQTPEGQTLNFDAFNKKWVLVYLNNFPCDQFCRNKLLSMKQLQKALGDKSYRLALLWVKTVEPTSDELLLAKNDLQIPLSKSTILVSDAKTNHYYLVDPFGNIVISYSVDIAPEFILDDIKRLL